MTGERLAGLQMSVRCPSLMTYHTSQFQLHAICTPPPPPLPAPPQVGMTEFYLPMDVGGNAREMVEAYVKACCGPHRKTATKLLLRPLEMGKVRKGCKEHRLVNSDFECATRLNLLQAGAL